MAGRQFVHAPTKTRILRKYTRVLAGHEGSLGIFQVIRPFALIKLLMSLGGTQHERIHLKRQPYYPAIGQNSLTHESGGKGGTRKTNENLGHDNLHLQ